MKCPIVLHKFVACLLLMYVYCFVQLIVILVVREEMGGVSRVKGGTTREKKGLRHAQCVAMTRSPVEMDQQR